MVFSSDLGYDPDEWEECPPPMHFLAFSASTRIILAVLTIGLSTLFFWALRKSDTHIEHEVAKIRKQSLIEDLKRYSQAEITPNIGRVFSRCVEENVRERSISASPKRRNSKRPFTAEEQGALINWEHEVQQAAEKRIRDVEILPGSDTANRDDNDRETETGSTFGLPSNAFENQSEASVQHVPTASRVPKYRAITETPPSTPPDGVLIAANEQSLRKRLAHDLNEKLLAETLKNETSDPAIRSPNLFSAEDEYVKIENEYDNMIESQQHQRNLPSNPWDSTMSGTGFLQVLSSPSMSTSINCNVLSDDNGLTDAGSFITNAQRISTEIDDTTADDIEFIVRCSNYEGSGQGGMSGQPYPPAESPVNVECSTVPTSAQVSPLSQQSTSFLGDRNVFDDEPERELANDPWGPQTVPPTMPEMNDEESRQMQKLLQEYDIACAPRVAFRDIPTSDFSEDVPGLRDVSADDSPNGFNVVCSIPQEQKQNALKTKHAHSRDTLSDDRTPYELLDTSQDLVRQDPRQRIDKNELEDAEHYLKEVMEFVNQERAPETQKFVFSASVPSEPQIPSPDSGHTFVMEEEMLESEKHGVAYEESLKNPTQIPSASEQLIEELHQQEQSAGQNWQPPGTVTKLKNSTDGAIRTMGDATSALIKTNEVFEKPENTVYDDADDAITYAPEIQSEEISLDQLSENENSLNQIENYLGRQESPPKRNSMLQEPSQTKQTYHVIASDGVAASAVIYDNRQRDDGAVDQVQFAGDLPAAQLPSVLAEKKPAPPALFSLKRGNESAAQQQTSAKKIPKFMRRNIGFFDDSDSTTTTTSKSIHKQSSLMSALGVTSTQEALLKLTSLDELSAAMRQAGLEETNLIFGIDYTASNKYQGERSFRGRSLHSLSDSSLDNPYQQVIKIMGRTLAPFSGNTGIPVFGFGDLTTGDWSVFPLNASADDGRCRDLDEVLRIYNEVTPNVDLSGPTNFAPLIYRAISICQKIQDYHILVIIADGQVTNERATRKAIVHACQYPLSIIVVGVGDGPWDMMKVFDESLPKRPWDNFHFVEFHEIINAGDYQNIDTEEGKALDFAVHSLLEVPDQYQHIRKLGLVRTSIPPQRANEQNAGTAADVEDGGNTPLPPATNA